MHLFTARAIVHTHTHIHTCIFPSRVRILIPQFACNMDDRSDTLYDTRLNKLYCCVLFIYRGTMALRSRKAPSSPTRARRFRFDPRGRRSSFLAIIVVTIKKVFLMKIIPLRVSSLLSLRVRFILAFLTRSPWFLGFKTTILITLAAR